MKSSLPKLCLLLSLLVSTTLPGRAETGYDGWLRYAPITDAALKRSYETTLPDTVVVLADTPILKSAQAELVRGVSAILGRTLTIVTQMPTDRAAIVLGTNPRVQEIFGSGVYPADSESFKLDSLRGDGTDVYRFRSIRIYGPDERGVLYGVFALLRKISLGESLENLDVWEHPSAPIRYLNHWDNPGGDIERGYAGRSIFWEGNKITTDLQRVSDYGRLLASIGVNGTTDPRFAAACCAGPVGASGSCCNKSCVPYGTCCAAL